MDGSFKTFLSSTELKDCLKGNTSLAPKSVSSEAGQEVSDADFTKQPSPLKTWEITYPLGGAVFRGGSKWKDETRGARLAWATCWTGRGVGSDPRLRLDLCFESYTYELEIELESINRNKCDAPVTYKEVMKALPDPRDNLSVYCDAIYGSIGSVGGKQGNGFDFNWMTADTKTRYEVLIKKVVSAALQTMENRRNENQPDDTCQQLHQ
ncbi:hypothetical protein QFC20_007708 [Naganishia adeliensis]|uniref:Uncharacterized protein n=1 Tax=Naganishia adeliensis TaxID=92952 RepID=A0ACC2UW58_9TREE|nr:hypothetical protein QFC20_007708 [Naganishia adeliensis]